MLKKLKEKSKFKGIIRKLTSFVLLGFFVFLFAIPSVSLAYNTIDAKQVNFSLSVSDNFFKVAKDGSVNFQVTLTLQTPDQLIFGSGTLFNSADHLARGNSGDPMNGFEVGLVSKAQNDSKCQNVSSAFNALVGSQIYYCQFPYKTSGWPPTGTTILSNATWNKGESKTFSVNLSAGDLAALGLTSNTSATGILNEVYVYPNFILAGAYTNTAFSPAKSVYLQVFSDTASLQQHQNDPRPTCDANSGQQNGGQLTCVPLNGSVTSSPNQQPGSGVLTGIFALVAKVIAGIALILQELIYAVFTFLLIPLMSALLSIRTYTDTFAGVIYPGWIIVRNACNILFVIAIIAIAMGTLFRLESYQYKHLLIQLIIGALLVNFSLVIGQSVLGLADTVQNQFLPNAPDVTRSIGKILILNRTNVENFSNMMQNNGASFAGVAAPLFDLSLAIGSFAVFGALVGFLAIRVVALWIYLMVSPVAYVAGVLPVTAKWRDKWWEGFIKYAFFTPIIAFFLNIAARLVVDQAKSPILSNISDAVARDATMAGYPSMATFMLSVGSNIILLIFIFLALQVADQLGIVGGSAISELGKKGLLAPFKLAGGGIGFAGQRGLGYVGRKWNEFTANRIRGHALEANRTRSALFAIANPKAFIKGWQKHSEELTHAAQAKAEAAGLEIAEQRLTGGKKIIPRVLAHEKEEEDKWAKTYMNMSRELVVQTLRRVSGMKNDDQGLAAKRAIVKVAMAKGYIDDAVQDGTDQTTPEGRALAVKMSQNHHFKIKGADEAGWERDWEIQKVEKWDAEQKKMVPTEVKVLKYNDLTRRAMYEAMFTAPNGHMDVAAMRLITEEGEEEGKHTGHFEYLKDAWFNFNTGKWDWRPETGDYSGSNFAKTEMSKMQSRPQANAAHHSFLNLSNEGEINEAIFRVFATAAGENPAFMQERTAHQALSRSNQVKFTEVEDSKKDHVKLLRLKEADVNRIKTMMDISPEAVAGMYLRVTKQGSTPVDVKNFLAAHPDFQVTVVKDPDDKTEQGELTTINLRDHSVKTGVGLLDKWDGQGRKEKKPDSTTTAAAPPPGP